MGAHTAGSSAAQALRRTLAICEGGRSCSSSAARGAPRFPRGSAAVEARSWVVTMQFAGSARAPGASVPGMDSKSQDLGGRFSFSGTPFTVKRVGYGAMQLAGPGVYGPPRDVDAALSVLREAVTAGVNHIDTSDFYGPHVTNEIIRRALHPYPKDLLIVTKLGARRPADKSWQRADSAEELTQGVHDNLRNLGLEALDIVNYRAMGSVHGPAEGSLAEQVGVLAKLQKQGLIRHVGLSNVTATQLAEAQAITPIVCVQNNYNLAHREDEALIDDLARQGIAYVPFFPLGGFSPLQSSTLSSVAERVGATAMQVALSWLLHRSPNILLIPGTSSLAHLRENLSAARLALAPQILAELNGIAASVAPTKH